MSLTLHTLGTIRSVTPHGRTVLALAERGVLELAFPGEGVVRVRISRRRRLPPYRSLSVSGADDGPPAPIRLTKSGDSASIRQPGLTVDLGLKPASLRFRQARGAPFATDLSIGFRGEHIVVRKAFGPNDRVYGLGEKTGWLDKRRRRYQMRTADVWLENPAGLGNLTDPLYASFPFFIVHHPRRTYGLFVDNPEFTEFDFTADDAYQFSAPAGVLTYYVFPGPGLPDVVRQYTGLTGRAPLPALWTLGYHQCRWGYASEADIRRVTAELRRRRIPADGIWMDIDYMDGYRVFTWDLADYPRPRAMMDALRQEGFRAVTIVDPGVKVDKDYDVYREGRKGGHFVRHQDGKEYHGSVWPGRSAFPDFHRPQTRAWWAGRVQRWLGDYGLSGIWNDMNEPAATDLSGPILSTLHEGGKLPHASARNTYGLQMARATYEGALAHDPDSRPFILTRAAFSGAQTVAALWGGDNGAQWEHLAGSLPMLMNLGLSGMPFTGVDVGGFMSDTSGELLARWTQAGAFYPFCRNHAAAGTNPHEPWAFGPEVEAICRRYLALRYQLLPYLYNLFYQSTQTGAPVMRPLVWHYPRDRKVLDLNDQFMLGPDLLVAPVLTPGTSARSVYLPRGRWFQWGTGAASDGPTHLLARAPLAALPLFVRGGAILPTWPAAQHTGEIDRAKVTLNVWPGSGRLDYYEDDGATQGYARGEFRVTPFRVHEEAGRVVVEAGRPRGRYEGGRKFWTVRLHAAPALSARLDGEAVRGLRAGRPAQVRLPDDGQKHRLVFTVNQS